VVLGIRTLSVCGIHESEQRRVVLARLELSAWGNEWVWGRSGQGRSGREAESERELHRDFRNDCVVWFGTSGE
jgi:hypothetical protein